jgi:hypothetical protein
VNATIPSSSVSLRQPTQGSVRNYAIQRVVDELAEAAAIISPQLSQPFEGWVKVAICRAKA